MKKLILIDGNSLLFRAYFAMRPMVTSKGTHTQGIYAFLTMLRRILEDYEPDYIAIAFDMKEKTFRHEAYPEYKAGRLKTPIELLSQIPLLHQILDAMNIAVLETPKYEADDIIGTLAKKASRDNFTTLIISGDKDELQLIDENTKVLINRKGMSEFDIYDINAMKEKYSIAPSQFIDLKGLMGDNSDNIPGIPGVGEKRGIALLQEYGSLESVLDNADSIPGKLGENIRNNIEIANLSKWLATIETNIDMNFVWDDFKVQEPDITALSAIFTDLEFYSFIKKLNSYTNASNNNENIETSFLESDFEKIKTVDLKTFIESTSDKSKVVIEALTDNNHVGKPDLHGIILYSQEMNLFCYEAFTPMNISPYIEALADKKYKLCGFDIKRTLYSLLSFCERTFFPEYDVIIAEYLLQPNTSKYSLGKMLFKYNQYVPPKEETLITGEKGLSYSLELDENQYKKRLFYINKVIEKQCAYLEKEQLNELFEKCDMPLIFTLARMEKDGISCNPEILESIGLEIDDNVLFLQDLIYRESKVNFNINSPKQLGEVLFDKMQIPYPKAKGKTGYSTSVDILDKIKDDYPIIKNVLQYRKLTKLKSTYVDGLMSLIGSDGKIHPHFNQTVAATGRLSCTEPNLQNIPIRDEYGRLIRKAFVASKENCSFTASDYSQIELRILASLSGDESLIKAFNENKDIHSITASRIFDIPEDKITSIDRTKAKAINFGIIYGMSGFGLSENLNITRDEGQRYINDYFKKHQAVKDYLDKNIQEGEEKKIVRTYFGRLRQIPEFSSRKYMDRELAKRLAMNTPIQGTAADIIKFAMNAVSSELLERGLSSKLILQIHDELIIEGPDSELPEIRDIVDRCMRSAADLAVELKCEISTGKNWYDLK